MGRLSERGEPAGVPVQSGMLSRSWAISRHQGETQPDSHGAQDELEETPF